MDALSEVDTLFRVDLVSDRKEIVAVISDRNAITFDVRGEATCYAHTGQHSTCHVSWYMRRTRAAKPSEFEALKKELEVIGYSVKVRRKRKTR